MGKRGQVSPPAVHTPQSMDPKLPKLTNCVGVLSTNCFWTSAAQEVLSPWITIHLMLFDQTFTCCFAFRAAAWQPTTTLVATMVHVYVLEYVYSSTMVCHKRVGVLVPWTLQCPVYQISNCAWTTTRTCVPSGMAYRGSGGRRELASASLHDHDQRVREKFSEIEGEGNDGPFFFVATRIVS